MKTPLAIDITFDASSLWWAAAAVLAVGALLGVWAYRGSVRPVRGACLALKLTGLAVLALCLLAPQWVDRKVRPGANLFLVLADSSASMQLRDRDSSVTRGERMRELLQSDQPWLARLQEQFDMRTYTFDSRVRRADGYDHMTFDGRSSPIQSALRTVVKRFEGRPLAGVLLLTDGNATDAAASASELDGLPPVYPVVIGGDRPADDLAIARVATTHSAFEDAPASIHATVAAFGYRGRPVTARVLDERGDVVEQQTQTPTTDDQTLTYRFRFRPESPGLAFYRVEVSGRRGTDEPGGEQSIEATTANNQRVTVVRRGAGPFRVLYFAGRPNWEYKFIRRAIAKDQQVELAALIRAADREPKFEQLGREGENANPLYRGFDRTDEQTESYDQPVLIRLNTEDESELRDGFPKTPEQLFKYHALILDDLEAPFFTRVQMSLIRRFVTERGGGLLMLGGQSTFAHGAYDRTPIADILPVYLDAPPTPPGLNMYRLELTEDGLLEPWARLRSEMDAERAVRDRFPPLRTINRVRAIKPGAQVIATLSDPAGVKYPGIVVHRPGRGRAAAVLAGDLWRWRLGDAEANENLYKTWRQMIRWLVADVPERVEIEFASAEPGAGQPAKLMIRVRDGAFEPRDDVTVQIVVTPPDGHSVKLTAEPSLTAAGTFEVSYMARANGGYRARAVVFDEAKHEVGAASIGWAVNHGADEFASLGVNRGLLQRLASRTGGEIVEAESLERFVESLPSRGAPIMITELRPLWHVPLVMLFALSCFLSEWGLRRWNGMP